MDKFFIQLGYKDGSNLHTFDLTTDQKPNLSHYKLCWLVLSDTTKGVILVGAFNTITDCCAKLNEVTGNNIVASLNHWPELSTLGQIAEPPFASEPIRSGHFDVLQPSNKYRSKLVFAEPAAFTKLTPIVVVGLNKSIVDALVIQGDTCLAMIFEKGYNAVSAYRGLGEHRLGKIKNLLLKIYTEAEVDAWESR